MTKANDERFVYYQECITSLNSAWQIITTLQETKVRPVIGRAAYHDALIDYAKPFKESRGKEIRSHFTKFPSEFSDTDKQLHDRIITLRDQFLAHSDITIKDAKVYRGKIRDRVLPLIISNTDPPLPEFDEVRRLIERLLDYLYQKEETNSEF
jgi:hypothetical protein